MTGSKEDMGVSDMKAEHVTTNEGFDKMGDSSDFPDMVWLEHMYIRSPAEGILK